MINISEIKEFNELNLRQTFRAHILYEQIMEHSFTGTDGLNGMIVLFYCYICGSNHDSVIGYNDYLDWLDENPGMLSAFTAWLAKDSLFEKKDGEENKSEEESKKA